MTPNLPRPFRILYFLMGVLLLLVPLMNVHGWIRIAAPIVGLMAIATGATGW